MDTLNRKQLESLDTVANCLMNRKRIACGTNSYEKELGFNPLNYVLDSLKQNSGFSWLDICCGEGQAMVQVADKLVEQNLNLNGIDFTGIDLVSFFTKKSKDYPFLRFIEGSIFEYEPTIRFDLITCVHGIHYLGDKLKLIELTGEWLKKDGLFTANFDTEDCIDCKGKSLSREIRLFIKEAGLEYIPKSKIFMNHGIQNIQFPFSYIGASKEIKENYTGQKTICSVYK